MSDPAQPTRTMAYEFDDQTEIVGRPAADEDELTLHGPLIDEPEPRPARVEAELEAPTPILDAPRRSWSIAWLGLAGAALGVLAALVFN